MLVWVSDGGDVGPVLSDPGPWLEVVEAAPGLLLVRTEDTLSRVYHEVKWRLAGDGALMVAPVAARPKAKGLASGTVSWLRARLP